jgi:branched-chain amino acid transport system permease protein
VAAPRSGMPRTSDLVRWVAALLVFVLVLLLPGVLSVQWMAIAVQALLLSLAVLALTMLAGYAGQFSIASGALLAVGAGVLAWLTIQIGLSPILGIIGAAIGGGLVGLFVGVPSLRLRGIYFLLATLAVNFIALYFFGKYVTNEFGTLGLIYSPLEVLGTKFTSDKNWFYLLVPIVALVMIFTRNVRRSAVGRSLLAIKQNEVAAAASGIDVVHLKLSVFVISSALTAVAGALYGYYFQSIASNYFTLQMAINMYVALIVGGQLSPAGAVVGSVFVSAGPTVVSELSKSTESAWLSIHGGEVTNFIFGALIIVMLLVQPAGIWGAVEWVGTYVRDLVHRRGPAAPPPAAGPPTAEGEAA